MQNAQCPSRYIRESWQTGCIRSHICATKPNAACHLEVHATVPIRLDDGTTMHQGRMRVREHSLISASLRFLLHCRIRLRFQHINSGQTDSNKRYVNCSLRNTAQDAISTRDFSLEQRQISLKGYSECRINPTLRLANLLRRNPSGRLSPQRLALLPQARLPVRCPALLRLLLLRVRRARASSIRRRKPSPTLPARPAIKWLPALIRKKIGRLKGSAASPKHCGKPAISFASKIKRHPFTNTSLRRLTRSNASQIICAPPM